MAFSRKPGQDVLTSNQLNRDLNRDPEAMASFAEAKALEDTEPRL